MPFTLAGLLLLAGPPHLPPETHPEAVLAEDLAPILWLAEDEPLYPMLPHAFAFDGRDNGDTPGGVDLADVQEINYDDPLPATRALTAGAAVADEGTKLQEAIAQVQRVVRAGAPLPDARVLFYGPAASRGRVAATFRLTGPEMTTLRAGTAWPDVIARHARAVAVELRAPGPVPGLHERIGDPAREWYLGDVPGGRDAILHVEDDGQAVIQVGPGCRFEFWFYYLYDLGLNGHQHDAEHAYVFVDPEFRAGRHDTCRVDAGAAAQERGTAFRRPLVRGIVGAGHEWHTANNILVASPAGGESSGGNGREFARPRDNAVFPRGLPLHMPILVELGKHASAPDRSFDGRFDLGMDANVFPESVWGTRDVQSGNVGRIKLGRFENWFAFPRLEHGLLLAEGWRERPEYEAAFPAQFAYLKTLSGRPRTYRLFPLADLRDLDALLAATSRGERTAQDVADFLTRHRDCFWPSGRGADPVVVSPEALAAMVAGWTRRPDAKRDPWIHHDHRKPGSVFKVGLFHRFGLGLALRTEGGENAYGLALRLNEILLPQWMPLVGGSMLFNDTSLHLQGLVRRQRERVRVPPDGVPEAGDQHFWLSDVGFRFDSYRGRYFGWYAGAGWRLRSDTGCCRVNGGFAASVPSFKRPFPFLSATLRLGLRGEPYRLFGPRRPAGAAAVSPVTPEIAIELVAGMGRHKHPLDY